MDKNGKWTVENERSGASPLLNGSERSNTRGYFSSLEARRRTTAIFAYSRWASQARRPRQVGDRIVRKERQFVIASLRAQNFQSTFFVCFEDSQSTQTRDERARKYKDARRKIQYEPRARFRSWRLSKRSIARRLGDTRGPTSGATNRLLCECARAAPAAAAAAAAATASRHSIARLF